MLFSNEEVAKHINDHFEPAWQSVRPVPRVTIDFGNGTVVRRTLHGNVATYVTTAEGQVLDVLPGIYEPATYIERLAQLTQLFRYVTWQWPSPIREQPRGGEGAAPPKLDADVLKDYHLRQSAALSKGAQAEVFVERSMGVSIRGVELGTRIVLEPAQRIQARGRAARGRWPTASGGRPIAFSDDLPGWKALEEDTRLNETVRRQKIHAHLAELSPAPPERITKWLYREVLHADLDDPYLGLGKILFDTYPFGEEDEE